MSATDFLLNCNTIQSVFGDNLNYDDREELVRLFGLNHDRKRQLRLLFD
jgi:hypothetical protein